jgi:hypothetical protein
MIDPFAGTDGRAFLAYEATDLGAGMWHYEYAIYNMNLDASIRSFGVPVPEGAVVMNVGFHAPPQHAAVAHGDNYSSTPWAAKRAAGVLTWSTDDFATDPLANAIRFGTTYNFRFDANVPPVPATASVGLFKTGGAASVAILGPSQAIPTISEWGIAVLFLAIAGAGAALIRARAKAAV